MNMVRYHTNRNRDIIHTRYHTALALFNIIYHIFLMSGIYLWLMYFLVNTTIDSMDGNIHSQICFDIGNDLPAITLNYRKISNCIRGFN